MVGRWFASRALAGLALVPMVLLIRSLAIAPEPAQADYFADVGYTDLLAELGSAIPTGNGIGVNHTEAASPIFTGPYAPDPDTAELSGKSFTYKSGVRSQYGPHATNMAKTFYGNVGSTAPSVSQINVWDAEHYLMDYLAFVADSLLRTNGVLAPSIETQRLQNHSWVGGYADDGNSIDAIRRLDYAVNRDGFVAVVGQDNGASEPLPDLLGQGYNVISVGRSDGNHSHGLTTLDGTGRIKPEIVAPASNTSFATARVSSGAAMLLEHADVLAQAGATDANRPQVIKAVLLAGATKDEFVGGPDPWDRSAERPLDEIYGAGELNLYRSYHVLDAGRQAATDGSLVGPVGWDFNETDIDGTRYFFDVPLGYRMSELSALLTWHRQVTDGDPGPIFDPQSTLVNLDLRLHTATGLALDGLIDASVSPVDNLEHVYVNGPLGMGQSLVPGQYALEVVAPVADIAYGLAWFGNLILVGDVNLDDAVNGLDIEPFVDVVLRTAYQPTADVNQDGAVNGLDVEPFVLALLAGAGLSAPHSIPEPSTLVLVLLLLACCPARSAARRR